MAAASQPYAAALAIAVLYLGFAQLTTVPFAILISMVSHLLWTDGGLVLLAAGLLALVLPGVCAPSTLPTVAHWWCRPGSISAEPATPQIGGTLKPKGGVAIELARRNIYSAVQKD